MQHIHCLQETDIKATDELQDINEYGPIPIAKLLLFEPRTWRNEVHPLDYTYRPMILQRHCPYGPQDRSQRQPPRGAEEIQRGA